MSWSIYPRQGIQSPCVQDCPYRCARCHSTCQPYLEYEKKKHDIYNGKWDDASTKHDKYFHTATPTSAAKQRRAKEYMRKASRRHGGYKL